MPGEVLFQDQFKAIVAIVKAIETSVLAKAKAGGKGMAAMDVARVALQLKLNATGRELLCALIEQSEVVMQSECKQWLVPAVVAMDADYVVLN